MYCNKFEQFCGHVAQAGGTQGGFGGVQVSGGITGAFYSYCTCAEVEVFLEVG